VKIPLKVTQESREAAQERIKERDPFAEGWEPGMRGFGGADLRKALDTAGYIDFPDRAFSTNVFVDYIKEGEQLPALVKQWRKEYDFHLVAIPLNLEHVKGYKGVREFSAKIDVVGASDGEASDIADVGPDTEWKDRAISGSVKLGFDAAEALGALKIVPFADAFDASATFSYEWKPKVAKVTSGYAGKEATWRLLKAEGQSLDGGHELVILVRRPRQVTQLALSLNEAEATYDAGFFRGGVKTYFDEEKKIEVKFNESSPE
jgi:hypothetical protein